MLARARTLARPDTKLPVSCQPAAARAGVSGATTKLPVSCQSEARRTPASTADTNLPVICQPPTLAQIEVIRLARGISVRQMLNAAGVDAKTWYDGKAHHWATRSDTRARLMAALDQLMGTRAAARPPQLIAAFVQMTERLLGAEIGRSRRLANALCYHRPRGKNAAPAVEAKRIRRLAIYLTAVELVVENAELARALGCSRQNIKQARDDVHDLRDDHAAVDAMLDRVALLLKGDAA